MTILHWQQTHAGWSLWLRWMLATIAGAIVLLIALIPVTRLIVGLMPARPEAEVQSPLFLGMGLLGAAIGLAQWFVLRRLIQHAGWWVPATMAGYGAPYLLNLLLPGEALGLAGPTSMFLAFGLVLGIGQWLVLRGQLPYAAWWIVVSLAGWLLAFALIGLAIVSGLYVEPFDMLAAFFVPVAVAGAGIVRLLRRGKPMSPAIA